MHQLLVYLKELGDYDIHVIPSCSTYSSLKFVLLIGNKITNNKMFYNLGTRKDAPRSRISKIHSENTLLFALPTPKSIV